MKTEQILEAIEKTTGIEKSKILGVDRYKQIMFARHLYCHFAKEKTNATLVQIGNSINRHHSTVINSLKLISDMVDIKDEMTLSNLAAIENYLSEKYMQDKVLKIVLPYDANISEIKLYLKNQHKAKSVTCVKTT